MIETDDIICRRQGAAGVITLNRPSALNALTLEMVRAMRRSLDAWASDPAVTRIVLQAAGDRAFCAGGDIRRLYDLGMAGEHEEALQFWREEYQLNALIRRYPKPYIALIDGIVMGGGVGVSLHGSHRVAGDRYLFAMPEVGIGFFPDVGATYALPRLPDSTGIYIALTGDRLKRADGLALGLATATVPSERLTDLREALCTGESVDAAVMAHHRDSGPPPIDEHRAMIAESFDAETVEEILARLDRFAAGSEFARRCAETMRSKSPTSLSITLEQMHRGGAVDFDEAMRIEFRIVSRVMRGTDFYEGVRTTLFEKGVKPAWNPQSVEEVDVDAIAGYFAPLDRELELP
jgi:enoyl-CoA hydratase/carnithine racemase